MDDTAYGGYKFLYLMQAWRLAELLDWNHLVETLFPRTALYDHRSQGETTLPRGKRSMAQQSLARATEQQWFSP